MLRTTTNYDARLQDLYILSVDPKDTTQQLRFGFGFERGAAGWVCTGITKTMQKALVLLFTYDQFYDTGWGTVLQLWLQNGSIQRAYELMKYNFSKASDRVVELLNSQTDDFTPLDEKITSLELTSSTLDIAAGKITIGLKLVTWANTAVTVVLPISTKA